MHDERFAYEDTEVPSVSEPRPARAPTLVSAREEHRRTFPMPVLVPTFAREEPPSFARDRQDALVDPEELLATAPITRRDWLERTCDEAVARTVPAPIVGVPIVRIEENPFAASPSSDAPDWSSLASALEPAASALPAPEAASAPQSPPAFASLAPRARAIEPRPSEPFATALPPVWSPPPRGRFRDAHRALAVALVGVVFFGVVLGPIALALGRRAWLESQGQPTGDAEIARRAMAIGRLGFVVHLVAMLAMVPWLAFVVPELVG